MISCIAIDDEPLALQQMARYIGAVAHLNLVGTFESGLQALAYLHQHEVDLMFLDINMPDLNGMDFVKSLVTPPKVIFTTAYSEYAVEGFKVDALDYLLKPISNADFIKSANKARAHFETLKSKLNPERPADDFMMVKSGFTMTRVNFADIKYIEGMREYVRIHLIDNKPIMSLLSMKKLEEQLPQGQFMRVHRSYIVQLESIVTVERNRIVYDGEVYIPVGKIYLERFQEYLRNNSLQ